MRNEVMQECHRFENYIENGYWNLDRIYEEVLIGLEKIKPDSQCQVFLAIDTWGCDYVLLDTNEAMLESCRAYRFSNTEFAIETVNEVYNQLALYQRTGIQFQPFNTIYQLVRDRQMGLLVHAKSILFIADYLNFRLTGVMRNELTIASTSQLLDIENKQWDMELIKRLGLPSHIFQPISLPGSVLGVAKDSVAKRVGFPFIVKVCGSHDTASAFMSAQHPQEVIISSGTWSLLGTHLDVPLKCEAAMALNFTNEVAVDGSIRFLKNLMGMWVISSLKNEIAPTLDYEVIIESACSSDYKAIIDVNGPMFFAPTSMKDTLSEECLNNGIKPPSNIGDFFRCAINSTAYGYKNAIDSLEEILGTKFEIINIVGGGAKNYLLNEVIEEITQKRVDVGCVEASGHGNIKAQRMEEFNENRI